MQRPSSTEYGRFYDAYIALVPEDDILAALDMQTADMLTLLRGAPEAQGNVRHAPYTWSVKQVVNHMADTERVMAYRALRFARGDATPLPGFEETGYAQTAESDRRPLSDVVSELEAVRRSSRALFRSLPEAAWTRSGVANNHPVSVRALAYVIVGHSRHHTAILRQRLSRAESTAG
jgi:hypothetical protein